MNMDVERDRLSGLYAEKGDDELLDLNTRQDDLTTLAQQVLADVIKRRGLSTRPIHGAVRDEAGLHAALLADEVSLWVFTDTFDLSRVTSALEKADIPLRLVDLTSSPADDSRATRRQPEIELVVGSVDERRATEILQQEMGLQPATEAHGLAADFGEFVLLAFFEREPALRVAAGLGRAGISFVWDDPNDDSGGPDGDVSLRVPENRRNEAENVVATLHLAMPDDSAR